MAPPGSMAAKARPMRSRTASGSGSLAARSSPPSATRRSTWAQVRAATMLATPTCVPWKLAGSPRAVAAISSRWLIACSIPEAGAVVPATPIAMPLRVSRPASSARGPGRAAGRAPGAASAPRPAARASSRGPRARTSPATAG